MAKLTITNLDKHYGSLHVLKSVSVTAEDGEFVTLVGPSGCGKSTILKTIAGLETFDSGSIHLGTRNIAPLSPRERNIAMVFQEYSLYPHMDVEANLSFALRMRKLGRPEIDERVKRAATMLQIEHLLHKRVNTLSGGQKQRVAIGRAVVRKPQLYLFDEPLSNLDAQLRSDLRRELKLLHKRLGITSIYVTHDQLEAMNLSDRVVVLKAGEVQQFASPLEIYERPRNTFVAQFIGYPPMNLLTVTVQPQGGLKIGLKREGNQIVFNTLEPRLAPYANREILLGVRPEHLLLIPEGEGFSVSGKTVVAEDNGAVVTMDCETALGQRLLIQTSHGHYVELQNGDEYDVFFPKEQLHFFDPKTQVRI